MILYKLTVYFSFFLFTWYSYKLIRDVSGKDQYWHIPQVIFLSVVYLLPFVVTLDFQILWTTLFLGLQFPFIFNTGLNLYRINSGTQIKWTHTGKYDFLKFYQTVILFLIGIILILWKG